MCVDRGRYHWRVLRREISAEGVRRDFSRLLTLQGVMGSEELASLAPRSCGLTLGVGPDHGLCNVPLKPISSINLWRPHTCPSLIFVLDSFHLGNLLGLLSIPRMFPGLHLSLPNPGATRELRRFMAKASRGKQSSQSLPCIASSQAEQSSRHGRGLC